MALLLMSRTLEMDLRGLARSAFGLATCTGLLCALTSTAHAQDPRATSSGSRRLEPVWTGYHLKSSPGISLGLESYAGLAVMADSDGSRGHAITGGLSRLRINYLELGAGLQVSDLALVRWRQVGGFVGAYLPLVNWVDVDTTVGLSQRTYLNGDERYGPGGLDLRSPTLNFRLGFSDRLIDEQLGFRLGAALLVDVDFKHQHASWQYAQQGQETVTGATSAGGYSVGLVVCLGFDVMLRRAK
jgi:hypothetical protein